MSTNIDSLSIKITANVSSAKKSIDKLSASLKKLESVGQNTSFQTLKAGIEDVAKAAGVLKASADGVSKLVSGLNRLAKVRYSDISTAAIALNTLNTSISKIDEATVAKLERMADAMGTLRGASTVLGKTQATANAQPSLSGKTEVAEGAKVGALASIRSLITDARALGDVLSRTVKMGSLEAFASLFTGANKAGKEISRLVVVLGAAKNAVGGVWKTFTKLAGVSMSPLTNGVKSIGKGLTGATKKLGETFAALKRIAVYRLLRTMIKAITQALKEGIENLYQYSSIMGTQFQKSMDMLATSALYLKNSLAAMVSPIINAVAPAIDVLVDKFVELINYVNQFISSLTGKETWTAAKKIPTVFKDTEEGAKNTAKAIKSWTVGIDELNIIEDTGKGGSGSGNNALDYSQMFEERTVEKPISDFAAELKGQFEKGDWAALGTTIGTALNTAVTNINWTGIGGTLGTKIDGVVKTVSNAEKTFDFTNLGTKIGNGVTEMVKKIDWTEAGSLLGGVIPDLADFLAGGIEGIDWKEIGKALKNFTSGVFNRIQSWLTGKADGQGGGLFVRPGEENGWVAMGENLWDKLKEFISGLKPEELVHDFFKSFGGAVAAGILSVWGLLKGIGNDFMAWWDSYDNPLDAIMHIGELSFDFVNENISGAFVEGFMEVWNGGAVSDVQNKVTGGKITKLGTTIGSILGGEIGTEMWSGIAASADSTPTGEVAQALSRFKEKIREGVFGTGENSLASKFHVDGKGVLAKMINGIGDKLAESQTTLEGYGKTGRENVETGFSSRSSDQTKSSNFIKNVLDFLSGDDGADLNSAAHARGVTGGKNAANGVSAGVDAMKDFLGTAGSTLVGWFLGSGETSIEGKMTAGGTSSTGAFQSAVEAAKPNLEKVMQDLGNGSMTSFNKPSGDKTLTERMGNIATAMGSRFKTNASGEGSGIKSAMSTLSSNAMTAFNKADGKNTLTERMGNIGTAMGSRFKAKVLDSQSGINTSLSTVGNSAVTSFNKADGKSTMTDRFKAIATNAVGGATSGANSKKSGLFTAMTDIGNDSVKSFNMAGGEKSLTDRMKIIATNAVGGAAVGSLSKQAALNTNAKTLGNGLVTAFNMAGGEKSLTERMKTIGTNASGGAKSGFSSGESALLTAVKGTGKSVGDVFYKPDGKTSLYDRLNTQGGKATTGFADGFYFTDNQKDSIEGTGKTAFDLFKDNTTNGQTDYRNKFYGIGNDSATGYKNGVDDASKADWFKNAIVAWAQRSIDAFTGKLKTGSPSRVFKEIGEFSVEGYNIGIAEEGKTTASVVQQWADSFTSIPAAFAIDTSAVDTYDPGRYLQSVQTEVASHSSLSVEGVAEGMEVFFSRMLQPMLQQIADDTRRQADKNEQTVVELDGRVLTKTIEKQQRANGYRFAMA